MPPASLSTLAVMKPGPTTARKRTSRLRQPLKGKPGSCIARSAAVPQHRNHIVRGDDAGKPPVLVDDRKGDEVVFVEERRHFRFRRVGRARDIRLAEIGELRRRDGDGDFYQ